jgi:hypothetical protein
MIIFFLAFAACLAASVLVGLGLVKLTPNLYFMTVTPALFAFACHNLAQLIQMKKDRPFSVVAQVVYVAALFYLWLGGVEGLGRMSQGLSPVVRDIDGEMLITVLKGLAGGVVIAAALIFIENRWDRYQFRKKWRQEREEYEHFV